MRTPFIAGNWKLHNTITTSTQLAREIVATVGNKEKIEIAIAPVFTALPAVAAICADTSIGVAAQNCHCIDSGAFTGEVSAPLLLDAGCNYVIIGHSERRQIFRESDNFINAKVFAALKAGLKTIICIGETLEQRENDQLFEVITTQVTTALNEIEEHQLEHVVIAYEPVWAIGTGKTATSGQAAEVHAFIRGLIRGIYSEQAATAMRIIYGGSVKPNNISELMAEDDIDGALVGGASLNADDFSAIINYRKTLKVVTQ